MIGFGFIFSVIGGFVLCGSKAAIFYTLSCFICFVVLRVVYVYWIDIELRIYYISFVFDNLVDIN